MNKIINNKFKIGVVFCGGCNPSFDRQKLLIDMKKKYEESFDFSPYFENCNFDLILLINGCSSECLMMNDYKDKIFVLNNPKLIGEIDFPLNSMSFLL